MDNALQQAIAARQNTGAPTPQLDQQTGQAPAPMPQQTSTGPTAAQGAIDMNTGVPQKPTPSEEEIITKALIQRQKMLGNLKQQESRPTLQSMPIS